MNLTFEQLPEAVDEVNRRLERIEALLTQSKNKPLQENKNYLLKEAAGYCRMPDTTFRHHLKKGHVVGSKPGRSWIFSKQNLDEFLHKFRSKTREELQVEAEEIIISKRQ